MDNGKTAKDEPILRSIIVKKYRPQASQGGDITYIGLVLPGLSHGPVYTKNCWLFFFLRNMTTRLALRVLDNACVNQSPEQGLILHTDLGSQYTSHKFEKAIQEKKSSITPVKKAARTIMFASNLFMRT